jgi:hypothetical protein
MIKKGGARFEVHQQVQIAAVLPVAEGAGHLAPVAGIIRAMPGQRTGRIGWGVGEGAGHQHLPTAGHPHLNARWGQAAATADEPRGGCERRF